MTLRRLLFYFCLLLWVTGDSFAQSSPRGIRPSSNQDSPSPTTNSITTNSVPATATTPPAHKSTVPTTALATPAAPAAEPEVEKKQGVETTWYGHSFVYFVTRSGVRIAIDPFSERVALPFPRGLSAEVALISYDADDRDGGDRLSGAPMVFRGVTGVGMNRAGGILFRGTESWRDASMGRRSGKNIIYSFELDGVRFCHLGGIGYPLSSTKLQEIGHVDVLFVPVGNAEITIPALWDIATKTEAKWIVPIAYQNTAAGFPDLRPLTEFLVKEHPVVHADSNVFRFSPDSLPKEPTVLVLKTP